MGSSKPEINPAGILLAAGGSRRLGQPKQLVVWKNKYLINHIIENILFSEIKQLFVILGGHYEKISQVIAHQVSIEKNTNWRQGKSTSICAGVLAAQRERYQSVILFTVDQPFINPEIINQLILQAHDSDHGIAATCVKSQLIHPVLFKQKYFDQLKSLQGDQGGKQIIAKAKDVLWLDSDDTSLLLDIDTKKDLEELLGM